MHYSNLVVIEKCEPEEVEAAVKAAMGQFEDCWDWYQIGGRWTGLLDGYNPHEDPANIETCDLCNGTGKREPLNDDDFAWCGGCNGCQGKGKRSVWPTDYKRHDGDIVPLESVTDEQYVQFFRVFSHRYGLFGGEKYEPWHKNVKHKFIKQPLPPLEWLKKTHTGCLAVVVDNHN